MTKIFRTAIRSLRFDNLQSKTCTELRRSIQNLKWVGIIAVGVTFTMCGAVAHAQPQAKVARIGWLGIGSASSVSRYEEFRRTLRELGYVEGKNITFEYRSADNKLDRLPPLADELVRLKVDLLITRGTPEALALKNATRTIPIVFYDVTDP